MRVRCVKELERILCFLTVKGVVNCGIVSPFTPVLKHNPAVGKTKICVVGAGISGLAAAWQLRNFGYKVIFMSGTYLYMGC